MRHGASYPCSHCVFCVAKAYLITLMRTCAWLKFGIALVVFRVLRAGAGSMYSKHRLPQDGKDKPAEQCFADDVEDLYGENLISANRCNSILRKAQRAGIKRNQARDSRRRRLKRSLWPQVYEAKVRVWNKKLAERRRS